MFVKQFYRTADKRKEGRAGEVESYPCHSPMPAGFLWSFLPSSAFLGLSRSGRKTSQTGAQLTSRDYATTIYIYGEVLPRGGRRKEAVWNRRVGPGPVTIGSRVL